MLGDLVFINERRMSVLHDEELDEDDLSDICDVFVHGVRGLRLKNKNYLDMHVMEKHAMGIVIDQYRSISLILFCSRSNEQAWLLTQTLSPIDQWV